MRSPSFVQCFIWSIALAAAGACGSPSDPDGSVDAANNPLNGTWRIARSGAAAPTSPADCHALNPSSAEIVIAVGGSPEIAARGSLDEVSNVQIDGTAVEFSMGAVGFVSGEPGWGKFIGHTLELNPSGELVGTGNVAGCGDDLGCSWTLTVTATRVQ